MRPRLGFQASATESEPDTYLCGHATPVRFGRRECPECRSTAAASERSSPTGEAALREAATGVATDESSEARWCTRLSAGDEWLRRQRRRAILRKRSVVRCVSDACTPLRFAPLPCLRRRRLLSTTIDIEQEDGDDDDDDAENVDALVPQGQVAMSAPTPVAPLHAFVDRSIAARMRFVARHNAPEVAQLAAHVILFAVMCAITWRWSHIQENRVGDCIAGTNNTAIDATATVIIHDNRDVAAHECDAPTHQQRFWNPDRFLASPHASASRGADSMTDASRRAASLAADLLQKHMTFLHGNFWGVLPLLEAPRDFAAYPWLVAALFAFPRTCAWLWQVTARMRRATATNAANAMSPPPPPPPPWDMCVDSGVAFGALGYAIAVDVEWVRKVANCTSWTTLHRAIVEHLLFELVPVTWPAYWIAARWSPRLLVWGLVFGKCAAGRLALQLARTYL